MWKRYVKEIKMAKTKFLKRDAKRFSKFGKKRKKLLSWRKPKGRDNKMREKRRGYPCVVKIGYKDKCEEKLKIIQNVKDLEKINKDEKIILGSVGKKKKLEIIKKAKELKLDLENININSFLKKNEKLKKKEDKNQGDKK